MRSDIRDPKDKISYSKMKLVMAELHDPGPSTSQWLPDAAIAMYKASFDTLCAGVYGGTVPSRAHDITYVTMYDKIRSKRKREATDESHPAALDAP
jgi:hypothetical protein